jgi:hypothetical protein
MQKIKTIAIKIKNQNKNTSVEFISTIAKLGFSIRDNKDAAVKKINHFYNFITYSLPTFDDPLIIDIISLQH